MSNKIAKLLRATNGSDSYASMTHCSRATAFRELDQLSEMGVLQRVGQGRAVKYQLQK